MNIYTTEELASNMASLYWREARAGVISWRDTSTKISGMKTACIWLAEDYEELVDNLETLRAIAFKHYLETKSYETEI